MKTQEFADKGLQTVKMATLYELRLMLTNSAKEQYTTEELVEPFDRIAAEKDFFSFLQSLPNTLLSLSPCQFQFHPECSVLRSKVQNPKLQLWWYQGCMSQALGLLSDGSRILYL